MIYLFYFLGYVIFYYMMAKLEFDEEKLKFYFANKSKTWKNVFYNLLWALLSWLGILLALSMVFGEILEHKLKNSKPPKWL